MNKFKLKTRHIEVEHIIKVKNISGLSFIDSASCTITIVSYAIIAITLAKKYL